MKKISIFYLMAMLLTIGIVSCDESAQKDQNIANKIEQKEALNEDDYSRIIEYVGEYAKKAQKYVDMQINDQNNAEATQGMDALKEEYPLVDTFRNCLKDTPASQLSPANLEKVGKYAGLIEFTAPAGYEIQTNAKAAGLEEATPDSANGVVAGAVDEAKVEDKR